MLASKLALSGNRGRIIGWSHFFCACRTAPGRAPVASPPATLLRPWPSWAYFGATLGYLGAILGLSWACLGLLYLYITPADPSQHFLHLRFVDAKCLFLESSYLGCFQSYCWRILGAILGNLGLSCSHLGAILNYIGPILGPSRAFLGLSWLSFCGKLCVTQNLLGQISCNAKFANANVGERIICQCNFCVTPIFFA